MTQTDNDYIRRWAKKIKAIEYLGGRCSKCGDENIFHLCFHHKNTGEKENIISDMLAKKVPFPLIQKELYKCELICENCHRELHNVNNEAWSSINKRIYLEYKNLYKCSKCGYDKNISSLEFHHKKSDNKIFMISRVSFIIKNILDLEDYLKEELDKCDVLCANCHRETYINIDKFNELKDQIYSKEIKNTLIKIDRNEVWSMYNSGIKQSEIARHFNVSRTCIYQIIKLNNH